MDADSTRVLAVIPGKEKDDYEFVFARRQVRQLQKKGFNVTSFFLETRTSPVNLWREARRFRRLFRSFRPDVVHAHYGTTTALFSALLSSAPLIITFRGSDLNPSGDVSATRRILSFFFSQLAALGARAIICVSEGLRQKLWWRRPEAFVIPSGVDLDEFRPIGRNQARRALAWDPSERVILFNDGRAHSFNKRRDLVERATVLVHHHLPSIRLLVIDSVPPAKMPLYINAADVVVMASDNEGSPNIIKEALACNVPVCSVRVGDVARMTEGISNCLLVERTPQAIAEGLIRLLREPARSNGRDFAARFSSEVYLEDLCSVILSVSKGDRGGFAKRRAGG